MIRYEGRGGKGGGKGTGEERRVAVRRAVALVDKALR